VCSSVLSNAKARTVSDDEDINDDDDDDDDEEDLTDVRDDGNVIEIGVVRPPVNEEESRDIFVVLLVVLILSERKLC